MATQYRPAQGAQFDEDQAVVLGKAVEKLGGAAKPKQIVDLARPANSPLHSMFEWDDDAAAEKYRLAQARNHLNHLEIVVTIKGKPEGTRAFHSVRVEIGDEEETERMYCSVPLVRSNRKLSDQVIATALKELEGWQRRYSQYSTIFAPVVRAAKQVKAKIKDRKKARAK